MERGNWIEVEKGFRYGICSGDGKSRTSIVK